MFKCQTFYISTALSNVKACTSPAPDPRSTLAHSLIVDPDVYTSSTSSIDLFLIFFTSLTEKLFKTFFFLILLSLKFTCGSVSNDLIREKRSFSQSSSLDKPFTIFTVAIGYEKFFQPIIKWRRPITATTDGFTVAPCNHFYLDVSFAFAVHKTHLIEHKRLESMALV